MSGSGKSTLASYIENFCKKKQYKSYIVDGDEVRDKDVKKLGFSREDVLKNNLRIARFCLVLKSKGFDVAIVPVISPYEEIRRKVRSLLEPYFHLVYVKTDIDTLRSRDTKGLYSATDKGLIDNLIGYSSINPYDEPKNAEIIIETGRLTTVSESKNKILNYIENQVCVKSINH